MAHEEIQTGLNSQPRKTPLRDKESRTGEMIEELPTDVKAVHSTPPELSMCDTRRKALHELPLSS